MKLETASTLIRSDLTPVPVRGRVIFIQNQSAILNDADLLPAVVAVQKQLDQDIFPIWGRRAELRVVRPSTELPQNAPRLIVLDTSDREGLAGYHRVENGTPIAKIFVGTLNEAGMPWSITLSHELIEMLIDPGMDQSFQTVTREGKFLFVLQEICDPVRSIVYRSE